MTNSAAQNVSPARAARVINGAKPSLNHSATRVVAALAKCAAGQVASQNVVPQTRFFGHMPNQQSMLLF